MGVDLYRSTIITIFSFLGIIENKSASKTHLGYIPVLSHISSFYP